MVFRLVTGFYVKNIWETQPKTPITSMNDGKAFLREISPFPLIPKEAIKIIANKTKSLPSYSDREIDDFLHYAREYLQPDENKKLMRKAISLLRFLEDGEEILLKAIIYKEKYLRPEERKELIRKIVSLIKYKEEGMEFLLENRFKLKPEEIEEIEKRIDSPRASPWSLPLQLLTELI